MAGAMAFTPLIMRALAKAFPVRTDADTQDISPKLLHSRNNWIDNVACFLAIVGICAPLPLYAYVLDKHNPWGVGFGFGLMVILPTLWVATITLPKGVARWVEFWRFYERKYKINLRGVTYIFVPIAVLGVISACKIMKEIF